MEEQGVATAAEIGIDSLCDRLVQEVEVGGGIVIGRSEAIERAPFCPLRLRPSAVNLRLLPAISPHWSISMARLNIARSRIRSSTCSLVRIEGGDVIAAQ